jgi:hypothetical protein
MLETVKRGVLAGHFVEHGWELLKQIVYPGLSGKAAKSALREWARVEKRGVDAVGQAHRQICLGQSWRNTRQREPGKTHDY